MASKVFAGTPTKRYVDPSVKGTPSPLGLYPWSAFNAPLVGINGLDLVIPDTELDGVDLIALLFTSDIPVITKGVTYDDTNRLQNAAIAPNFLTTNFVKTTSGGATNAAVSQFGTVLQGYAGSGALVPVSGFPVFFKAAAPNGVSGLADYVCIECIANSANIDGVVGPTFFYPIVGGSPLAPIPVILKNPNYTPAIAAADNLITDSAGNLDQVVGLYASAGKG